MAAKRYNYSSTDPVTLTRGGPKNGVRSQALCDFWFVDGGPRPGEVAGDMATMHTSTLVSEGPPELTGYACPMTTVTGDQPATIGKS